MNRILTLRTALAWSCALSQLAGCAGNPRLHADTLAQQTGLQREEIAAGRFVLTAYVRITQPAQPLTVYIEGDGRAWLSRTQPSADPTPHNALGLQLAGADRAANVLYLARPCQFTPMERNPDCAIPYWTGKRFAPEVIAAMDAAISHYTVAMPAPRLNLVGYSGGGAVAVLLAARRHDVASLRTVAGNLDHDAVNRWHKVSPMPESLNPIDVAAQVGRIPQRHFSGAEDRVVPTDVARDFVTRARPCARLSVVAGLGHESDWAAAWPRLLAEPLPCTSATVP